MDAKRLEEIKTLLGNITHLRTVNMQPRAYPFEEQNEYVVCGTGDAPLNYWEAIAIRQAPDVLDELIAEVERLQTQRTNALSYLSPEVCEGDEQRLVDTTLGGARYRIVNARTELQRISKPD